MNGWSAARGAVLPVVVALAAGLAVGGVAAQGAAEPGAAPPEDRSGRAYGFVRGRCVAAEDGAPLAGCTVTVTSVQATGYPLQWQLLDLVDPAPCVTGGDGTFALAVPLPEGPGPNDGWPPRLHCEVTAEGRAPAFGHLVLTLIAEAPGRTVDTGDLALPRAERVSLRVVDESGEPQPNVAITARALDDALATPAARGRTPAWPPAVLRWAHGVTDEDGIVRWWLAAGRHRVELRDRAAATGVPDLVVVAAGTPARTPAPRPRTIVLREVAAEHRLIGTVRDERGAPVAGLALTARFGVKSAAMPREPIVRTDAAGRFTVAAPDHDAPTVELLLARNRRHDGWHSLGEFRFGERDAAVVLPATGTLVVTAVHAASGEPVPQFGLVCTSDDPRGPRRASVRAANGTLRLDGLGAGRHRLRVVAADRRLSPSAWSEVVVRPGATTELRVALPPAVPLAVRVTDAGGAPVAAATVEVLLAEEEAQLWQRAVPLSAAVEGAAARVVARAAQETTGADGRAVLPLRSLHSSGERAAAPPWLRVRAPRRLPLVQRLLPARDEAGAEVALVFAPCGVVRANVGPAERLTALDATTAEETLAIAAYGETANAWHTSVADLRSERRAGLGLAFAGESVPRPDQVVPIGDDGTAELVAPPGRCRLYLITWSRQGRKVERRARELCEVNVAADGVTGVRVDLAAEPPVASVVPAAGERAPVRGAGR